MWHRNGVLAGQFIWFSQPVHRHHRFYRRHYHWYGNPGCGALFGMVVACHLHRLIAGHDLLFMVVDSGSLCHQHVVPVLHGCLGCDNPCSHFDPHPKCGTGFDQSHTTYQDDSNNGRLANDHRALSGDRCVNLAALWRSNVLGQKWTRKNSTPCPDRSSPTRMWKRSKLPRSLCCVRQAATLKYTCSHVLPPWILPLVQSSCPVVAPTPMTRSMISANQQGRCCWNICTVGRKLHWVTRTRTKHLATHQ